MNIGDNEGLPTPKELKKKHSRKATRQKLWILDRRLLLKNKAWL